MSKLVLFYTGSLLLSCAILVPHTILNTFSGVRCVVICVVFNILSRIHYCVSTFILCNNGYISHSSVHDRLHFQ